jgi:drug/metabolite transporter (DMT)-like permease
MILIAVMHIFFATIFPIGRLSSVYVQPLFFTGLRMVCAGILFLGFQYVRGIKMHSDEMVSYGDFKLLSIIAILGIFWTNSLEVWALQFVPAAKAAFIYSLSPFWAAIISYLLFSEKFTLKKYIGMAIGVAGFLLLVSHNEPFEITHEAFGIFSYGELALISTSLATVIGWTAVRFLMRDSAYGATEVNGITMIWGGILSFVASLMVETWNPVPMTEVKPALALMALSILCTNVVGYTLYAMLVKRYSVTLLSFASFIEPMASALLSWVFLGEAVTWHFYGASILVFVGLYIFYQEELHLGYVL